MTLRLLPSDPEFEVFAFLADCIAKWKNAHIFWDLRSMPEAERLADIAYFEELFEELTH